MPVYKRGSGYQANFMLGGQRYRETFQTEAQARAWEAQARAEHALGKPVTGPSKGASKHSIATIGELVRYTERRHWTHKTSGPQLARNAYLFRDWVGAQLPIKEALDEDLIEDYLTYREVELRNSGSTVNRHRAAISKLATMAVKLGLIDRKPDIQARKEGDARTRVFTHEEEEAILMTVEAWGYPDHRDLFIFLADTGCRLAEAEKMPWEAFTETGLLEIPASITKSSKGRIIGLTDRVREVVARMRAKYGKLEGPFAWHRRRSTRTLWERLRGHLDFMDKHTVIHTYRHTCASRLVQEQGFLDPVQRWLGHSSPQMTQRYAKWAPKNYQELASLLDRRRESRVEVNRSTGERLTTSHHSL